MPFGFRAEDIKGVVFSPVVRRVEIGGVSQRVNQTDATVTLNIRDEGGTYVAEWQHSAQNVGFNFDWYDAAFRASAWDAYKRTKGFTEV